MNAALMTARYARFEVARILRVPRLLIFSALLPVIMFVAFTASQPASRLGAITVGPYIMISMASFGVLTSVVSIAGRISLERSGGWSRQLRLTALTGGQYLTSKILSAFALALPGLVAVFVAAGALGRAHLSAEVYVLAGVSVLAGMLPLAGFAIWLGYGLRADNAMQVTGGLASLLALAGGIWVPVEQFPGWLADIAKALPMYWAGQAGRDVIAGSWVGWQGLLTLAAWAVGLGWLAARAYTRDQSRA
jgi:ABC-2 type transport system permease protein